jgi:xylulokinase
MHCTLGIDVSTTATKALILDESGTVLGTAASAHSLQTPRPLWSEQDPDQWWKATCRAVQQVLKETGLPGAAVSAIGLSGQMHGLVLLDATGRVLRPAILWNDQRASAECDLIRNGLGLERLVAITGNDAFPGFTAPKLLWVREHEPEIYRQTRHVLLPKDYIRYRLTDAFGTDRAGAGGTLLLNLETRDWSSRLLDELDIPADWLPPTHEGPSVTGTVMREAAERTGLSEGTPVVAGAGDQAAQAVGVGAISPDVFALTVGTSGVVFAPCDHPVVDPRGRAHAFPHAIPERWHVMGVMLSAAGSLAWYREAFAPDAGFETLIEEAGHIPPGSEGLFFLPYLSGERTPHADPDARGAFTGLTLRHGRGHLTRAVLEGVAFGLRDNLKLLQEAGLPRPEEIRASGGALKSPLWSRILADVLGHSLVPALAPEGAALGAAMLAGLGAGIWSVVGDATGACVRTGPAIEPDPAASEHYRTLHDRFREHYPALKRLFRA